MDSDDNVPAHNRALISLPAATSQWPDLAMIRCARIHAPRLSAVNFFLGLVADQRHEHSNAATFVSFPD